MEAFNFLLDQYVMEFPPWLVNYYTAPGNHAFNGHIEIFDDPLDIPKGRPGVVGVPERILKHEASRRRYGFLWLEVTPGLTAPPGATFHPGPSGHLEIPFPVLVVDLPTQHELWKTLDGTSFVKTADAGQLLKVGSADEDHGALLAAHACILAAPAYMQDDGITPPSTQQVTREQYVLPLRPYAEDDSVLAPPLTRRELTLQGLKYSDTTGERINRHDSVLPGGRRIEHFSDVAEQSSTKGKGVRLSQAEKQKRHEEDELRAKGPSKATKLDEEIAETTLLQQEQEQERARWHQIKNEANQANDEARVNEARRKIDEITKRIGHTRLKLKRKQDQKMSAISGANAPQEYTKEV